MSALPGAALDPHALAASLATALLLLLRLAPLTWLVPWALVQQAPTALSWTLTIVLAICVWPGAIAHAGPAPQTLFFLFALGLRELLLGTVMALALALPLRALEWGGSLQGRFSGLPGAERPLATLQLWLGLGAFFALGGHRLTTAALAQSVVSHPLGVVQAAPNFANVALGSARLVGDAFGSALQIALPLAAALGLAELGVGLVARTTRTPWFPPAIAPARSLLAMFVIWIGIRALAGSLPEVFRRGLAVAQRFLETL